MLQCWDKSRRLCAAPLGLCFPANTRSSRSPGRSIKSSASWGGLVRLEASQLVVDSAAMRGCQLVRAHRPFAPRSTTAGRASDLEQCVPRRRMQVEGEALGEQGTGTGKEKRDGQQERQQPRGADPLFAHHAQLHHRSVLRTCHHLS